MSHEPNIQVSDRVWPTTTILNEIDWCEKRIQELQPKLLKKPSTQREINDLLRQIEDKKKVLKYRSEAIHT